MPGRNATANPLALPVLALLRQRPMHPYEMATEIRRRHWHGSVKLTNGTLYAVVGGLVRGGLVVPKEISREGRRPERTTYALTDAGRAELFGRLREMLSQPAKEYTRFAAGLTLVAILPRNETLALLEERARLLAADVDRAQADLDAHRVAGLPRLFALDAEHALVLRRAELAWVRGLVAGIADGSVTWPTGRSNATEPSNPPADDEPGPPWLTCQAAPGNEGGAT